MRICALALASLFVVALGHHALADDGPAKGSRKEQLLEKFDANGDGKLNDEERAKAREAFARRRGKGAVEAAGRGDCKEGKSAGRRGPRPELREKMLEKFDADGDGKLNEEERARARATFQRRGRPQE